MPATAGAIMLQNLQQWGVEVVFGLPGDGINGLMEALRKARREIRFVQVRHEEAGVWSNGRLQCIAGTKNENGWG